jgi:hypothetical protein
MNFAQPAGRPGLDRRWAGARVRRHSFRHASGQAMGRRKSSPKFISARVWTGDGQAQEFADIHFGTGQGRQWETEMNFGQPAGRPGRRRRWAGARVRRNSFRHGSGQAMGDRNEFRSTGRASGSAQAMGRRKSSPKFISARVWTGDGQAQEFADIHFGTGQGRQWETEMNFGQPAGRPGRRRRWVTEMNFGQRAGRRGLDRRWAGARVRRNSFRHGSGQAMGDRNEFRSTGRASGSAQAMGRRKSSPKFISARVWTGDGQAQEFADIHFGMGLDRRWETEMNVAQPAGRPGRRRRWAGARVRRHSFRHGSGQAMGDRNEFRSTGRASGSAQAMGRRKSSPTFISAWVWTGDGRPK